jgi:hypothetical protein
MPRHLAALLLLVTAAGPSGGCAGACGPRRAVGAPPAAPASAKTVPGFVKGQLHAHSNRSADSRTPPLEVARWYAERGYDFLVLTDHNRVTSLADAPLLVIPGVEITQNLDGCGPPEPAERCLLHVNALFADEARAAAAPPPAESDLRADVYERALAVAASLGGLAQVNHPNFHYGADAGLLAALAGKGARFVEVWNLAVDSNNEGDTAHPSTEALWDAVLTGGATLWGVASDDAHHYYDALEVAARGGAAHTGDRGFVMVRAPLERGAIRAALERGDFYSSSGVLLDRVEARDGALTIAVAAASPGEHTVTFIGAGGAILAQERGRAWSFPLARAAGGYVRAVVGDERGRRAWTQPVRVPAQ